MTINRLHEPNDYYLASSEFIQTLRTLFRWIDTDAKNLVIKELSEKLERQINEA